MQERRRTRLADFDHASAGAYFVTACARDRRCLFGAVIDDEVTLSPSGRIVAECWHELPDHFRNVILDAFVVMPSHLHGILMLERAGNARPQPAVVGALKSAASRRAASSLWQRGYHDRVIRSHDELRALRQYIADNPVRWAVDRENPVGAGHARPAVRARGLAPR